MMARLACALVLVAPPASAVIVDRIAIIVANHVIKDSDIVRDIRIVSFLNHEPPVFTAAARKQAASRLIDQQFIRDEIELGAYPTAPVSDAAALLDRLRDSRSSSGASWEDELALAHIAESELQSALLWQLTVLHFISLKFRPGVIISEDELHKYYAAHREQLEAASAGRDSTFDAMRSAIETTLVEERVNQLFYDWLDEKRKETHIEYREAGLQ